MSDNDSGLSVEIVGPEKRKPGRPKGLKNSREIVSERKLVDILSLKAKGMDQRAIAAHHSLSQGRISQIIRQFSVVFEELKNVPSFREVKSDIYDAGQLAALKSLVMEDKLNRAGVRDLALTIDILGKHSRLERGLSTANNQNLNLNASFTLDGFLA